MLEVNNLTYKIKDKCLFNDISLKIDENELVFLLGPNGCGKSTLLNIVSNAIRSKKININNTFNSVFYLSDKFTLINNYSSVDNLLFFCSYFKSMLNPYELKKELMIEDRLINKLSKGNRQKLGLAIALMSTSELILIDEALDGLDGDSIRAFIKLLRKSNKSALCVTHDNRVFRYKNVRRIKIEEGKLIEC